MAKTTIWNADVGPRVVGQDIYDDSASATCKLGSRLVIGDRVFRYCYSASAGTSRIARLSQGPARNTYDEDIVVPTTSPIGSRIVHLTHHSLYGAPMVADALADGYFAVGSGTGLGYSYKIKSNTFAAVGALLTLTLYDPLIAAVTATTNTGIIVRSPYYNTIIDAATGMLAGVPLIIPAASSYYWSQTWGPVGVIGTGSIVIGQRVVSNGDGTVAPVTGIASEVVRPIVGIAMQTSDTGDTALIFLQIAP